MPDFLGNIQQQLNDFWQGLENGQKIKLVSVVVLCTLAIAIGIYALSRPSYEVLFKNLTDKDMVDAQKKLSELQIENKISDDGFSLMVPTKDKQKARIELYAAGIPKQRTGTTDASASKTSLGTTESDKRRQRIADLSAEIEQDLMDGSDKISDARVNLNIPDSSGFLGEDKKSTASVRITPNGELPPSYIEGIARFVASSVEGLDPKNVEVVDNNMKPLKDFDDETIGGADKQYNLEKKKKVDLEKEITALLSNQSTEFDEAKVLASIKLDFDSQQANEKTLTAPIDGNGAVISKSEKNETLINGNNGGVPGTDSNSGVPSYPNGTTSNGSSYSNSDNVTNYAYNETQTQKTKALGQIDKNNSSIAVTLYYGNKVDQLPSQDTINNVAEVVSKASGLSTDKITVKSFKIAKDTQAKSNVDVLAALQRYGPFIIATILVGLLAFATIVGPRKFKAARLAEEMEINLPNTKKKKERTLDEIELEEKSEVRKQIDKFVKQKPEAVASLLRNWLAEDWE